MTAQKCKSNIFLEKLDGTTGWLSGNLEDEKIAWNYVRVYSAGGGYTPCKNLFK